MHKIPNVKFDSNVAMNDHTVRALGCANHHILPDRSPSWSSEGLTGENPHGRSGSGAQERLRELLTGHEFALLAPQIGSGDADFRNRSHGIIT